MATFIIFLILSAGLGLIISFVGFLVVDFFVNFKEGIFGLNIGGYSLYLIFSAILTLYLFWSTFKTSDVMKEWRARKGYVSRGKQEDRKSRGFLARMGRKNSDFSSKGYEKNNKTY